MEYSGLQSETVMSYQYGFQTVLCINLRFFENICRDPPQKDHNGR